MTVAVNSLPEAVKQSEVMTTSEYQNHSTCHPYHQHVSENYFQCLVENILPVTQNATVTKIIVYTEVLTVLPFGNCQRQESSHGVS